ncbi:MAG: chalcone isomerase family protein [Gammaproteobacteria bacterium]|nr:chalcone isomerase family protein [Gammaproteobacteria bacterium]
MVIKTRFLCKCTHFFILLFAALFSLSLNARQLDDVNFPDTVSLPGTDTAIHLNGMGYRTKFIFKVYVGGLYLQSKANSRDAVQALAGPKRVVMYIVYDEVGREKIINGWKEGFEDNTSDQQLEKLQSRLKVFSSYFPDLKAGDEILLDYIPARGTRVTINGEEKGVIAGADFYAALLDVWLGKEPADEYLKDAMLGLKAEESF